MTDTPETDAFFFRTDIEWDDEVEFARELERLRDAIRNQRDFAISEMERLEQERDQWRDVGLRHHNLLNASASREERLRERCRQLVQHAKDLYSKGEDARKKSNAELEDALEFMKERNEARHLAESAMLEADRLRSQLWRARDRAWKLARQRSYWRLDCLEQCKLLAMGADREEKMRDAFRYIARLDTSQNASPEQCSAVAVAMEALQ